MDGINLGEALQRFEGVLIEQALERTRGNRTQAAALLRINRTTLVEKLKRREEAGDNGAAKLESAIDDEIVEHALISQRTA